MIEAVSSFLEEVDHLKPYSASVATAREGEQEAGMVVVVCMEVDRVDVSRRIILTRWDGSEALAVEAQLHRLVCCCPGHPFFLNMARY